MRTAVFPGSFDPFTLGHLEVVESALSLFGELVILVGVNPEKSTFLSPEFRLELIRKCTGHLENVKVEACSGLVADYLRKNGLQILVRGLRNSAELEWERSMAWTNAQLLKGCKTVFLPASPVNLGVSSTLVRDLLHHGGDISALVPREALALLHSVGRKK